MKNRKLFAIITLVAFMLTMMPLMAFADVNSSSVQAWIDEDDTSVRVGNTIDLNVKVKNVSEMGTDQKVVLWATVNGALTDVVDFSKDVLAKTDFDTTGSKVVTIGAAEAGTYKIGAALVTGTYNLRDVVAGTEGYAIKVDNGTVTFKSTTNDVTIKASVDGSTPVGATKMENGKEVPTTEAERTFDTNKKANNGVDKYEVTLALTKGADEDEVAGQEVTIEIDKSTGYVSKTTAKTNSRGVVTFKVSASKTGTYTVNINSSKAKELELKFVFGANNTAQVVPTAPTSKVAVNEDLNIDVKVIDANGTTLKPDQVTLGSSTGKTGLNGSNGFGVEFTKVPAGSDTKTGVEYVAKNSAEFVYDADDVKDASKVQLLLDSNLIDEAGDYTVKVYNKNTGGAKYIDFTAAEYGKTVSATIEYDAASYNLESKVPAPTVKIFDANGVSKKVTTGMKFSFTGVGVVGFDKDHGDFTVTDEDKYLGQTITVNVIVDKCIATTTVAIADVPAYLKFTDTTAAIGTEATVPVQSADLKGNLAAIGDYYTVDVNYVVIEKPEGAVVSVDASDLENNAFRTEGKGNIKVACTKEGTVKVNVVATATKAGAPTIYLTGVATVGFGAAPVDNGVTSTVTLIIGSKTFVANGSAYTSDVAPYVANGRTFVPVRAFAEATGAKVEYDAATQVITITAEGLNAQMTIGSNILTVNGQTTVMDVAAAVTADGRTVLPVRFAGQALGYGFEVAYGSNGAVSSVTMFK